MVFRCFIAGAALVFSAASSFGQGAPPPVAVKRVRAQNSGTTAPNEAVPAVDQYPFNQLITQLENGDPPRPDNQDVREIPQLSEVPKDWPPPKDVPLSQTELDALSVSESWMTEKQTPTPGKDGRVLYTFGAGLPTVVCAPLRVCILELEPGEKVISEPHIGDSVRWSIAPATSGQADLLTPMIVIKPRQAGLDTNLLVTTDRRAYYVRLISKSEEYLPRVAFSYPEDDNSKWKVLLAQQEQRRKQELENSRIESIDTMENLYFDYRLSSRQFWSKPSTPTCPAKSKLSCVRTSTIQRRAAIF